MSTSKKSFDIDRLSKTTTDAQIRQAQALEFIAHYLELVEGHLDKLVNPTGKKAPPVEAIQNALYQIATILAQK